MKNLNLLKWSIVAVLILIIICVSVAIHVTPRNVGLLVKSTGSMSIQLPDNCVETATAPSDDGAAKYLENERHRRGLIFSKWIICDSGEHIDSAFSRDPHWLPTYTALAYQYRRAVVILRPASTAFEGSKVVGQLCLMPWRSYASETASDSDRKFSVWE